MSSKQNDCGTSGIGKRSSIYALGALFPKTIEYVLLPLWTRWLSAAEFGLVGLVVAICKFASSFLTLGAPAVLSKELYNKDRTKASIARMISSNMIFIIFCALVTIFLIYAFPEDTWQASSFLKDIDLSVYGLTIAAMVLGRIIMMCGVSLARVQRLAIQSVACDGLGLLLGLLAGLYLVGYAEMGAKGRLIGMAIGFGISAILYVFYVHRKQITLEISLLEVKNVTSRGLPLVLHSIAGSIIMLSDRFYVMEYCGLEETGLYTLATTLALVISVIGSSMSQAWQPEIYEKLAGNNEEKSIDFVSGYLKVVGCLSIAIILSSGEMLTIIAGPEFYRTSAILPILVVAMVWQTLYFYAANLLKYRLKTKTLSVIAGFVAILNVGLNIYLVPIYRGQGAAVGTCVALAVMFGLVYYYSRQDVKLFMNLHKLWYFVIFLILSLFAFYYLPVWSLLGVTIKLVIIVSFMHIVGWTELIYPKCFKRP